jgi:adenine deaminase
MLNGDRITPMRGIPMELASRIDMALGKEPADLLLRNARLVNVLSGEIHSASIAVRGDRIAGIGEYEARDVVDLEGRWVTPGFIDGHLHLESSMLSIPEFARNVVPLGATAVVADPHEIANVLGTEGIRYMLDSSEGLPLRVFLMIPSCVPATPFETSGAELGAKDLLPFAGLARIQGLAEVMNFPGVLAEVPDLLAKMETFKDKVIDGHAPGLSGKELCAYVAAGVGSDHECTGLEEAKEKLRLGMRIMIREGSAAKNMDALLPLVNAHNSRNCFLVTDDMDPRDIMEKGHVGRLARMAIAKGLDPLTAIQMITLNPARYFRLSGLGAVAPGNFADLVVLDDLETVRVDRVFAGGQLVAQKGAALPTAFAREAQAPTSAMNVDWTRVGDLSLKAEGRRANVIGVVPGQIVTKRLVEDIAQIEGLLVSDPARDILKISVIERHKGTGAHATALIKGFGLKAGALASTVAHDSHNIVTVGVQESDMLTAARAAAEMGGGMTVAKDGKVLARLPLPIAGLMSPHPVEDVVKGLREIIRQAHALGCPLEGPFATLSFMALTPIPELKITDQGLFDSINFRFVSLWET